MEPVTTTRILEPDIVDQAGVLDADGAEAASLAVLDVVDAEAGRGEVLRRPVGVRGFAQDPGKGRGQGPRVRGEPAVARAEGEAVGLAHRGTGDDLDGKEEGAGHSLDELQLLPVLFAEVGAVRPDEVEE